MIKDGHEYRDCHNTHINKRLWGIDSTNTLIVSIIETDEEF